MMMTTPARPLVLRTSSSPEVGPSSLSVREAVMKENTPAGLSLGWMVTFSEFCSVQRECATSEIIK